MSFCVLRLSSPLLFPLLFSLLFLLFLLFSLLFFFFFSLLFSLLFTSFLLPPPTKYPQKTNLLYSLLLLFFFFSSSSLPILFLFSSSSLPLLSSLLFLPPFFTTDLSSTNPPPRKRPKISPLGVWRGNMEKEKETREPVRDGVQFSDNDVARLMIQCLHSMGLSQSASCLEEESGVEVEEEGVVKLRERALKGDWEGAVVALEVVFGGGREGGRGEGMDRESFLKIKYVILRQKFFEFLENDQKMEATLCLRNEISPLIRETARKKCFEKSLQKLSNLLLLSSEEVRGKIRGEEGERKEGGGGKGEVWRKEGRKELVKKIQQLAPIDKFVPEDRLKTLIAQAVTQQQKDCRFHNKIDNHFSLFQDHHCQRNQIPDRVISTLEGHDDEVWFVKYSHGGDRIASSSCDGCVIVWDISCPSAPKIHCQMDVHEPVSYLSWSPDDTKLLGCGASTEVKMWNVENGRMVKELGGHGGCVAACSFSTDGKLVITGGLDKTVSIIDSENSFQGSPRKWDSGRVSDLAVCGSKVVFANSSKNTPHLVCMDLNTEKRSVMTETQHITSICLSKDGKHVLANTTPAEIHLWDLTTQQLVQTFVGHKQTKMVIRSCFGGVNETFVVGGSEDGGVYIWHRYKGCLLEKLEGHKNVVNCVAWNPRNPYQFASASDDNTIKIWSPDDNEQETDVFIEDDSLIS